MPKLSARDRELVALGAAMGSNCVPCIEYHIPKAREVGLSDSEISEAIRLSDKVRQVPARKVLNVALQMVGATPATSEVEQSTIVWASQPSRSHNANASAPVAVSVTKEAPQPPGARCCL